MGTLGSSLRRAAIESGLVALIAVACGCLGGQSTDNRFECEFDETELSDDNQPSPVLGLAPADVLAWALGSRSSDARWLPPPMGISANVAPGETMLELELVRGRGPAVEVVGQPPCEGTRIRVPVEVGVRTQDGALAESLRGELSMVRAGYAQVAAEIDLAALDGTLRYRAEDPQLHLLLPQLSAALTPDAGAGALGAALERRTHDAVSLLPGGSLLQWPAAGVCGALVAQALSPEDPDWSVPVGRVGAERWSMAGTPNDDAASAMVEITLAGVLCEAEDGSLTAPTSVRLRWDDVGVDLSMDATFSRQAEGLELALKQEGRFGGAPANFAARFGDFGLALAGYEHVQLELSLSLGASGAHGVFAVVGFEDTCQAACTATGCAGCGGLTRHVLLALALDRAP